MPSMDDITYPTHRCIVYKYYTTFRREYNTWFMKSMWKTPVFYGKSLDNIYLAKYNMAKDRDKSYPEEEHHGTGIRAVITW